MLNTQSIEMLNSALPAGANVHILDDSDNFSRLVGSLQNRGIIRRDIQLRPLYESTYAVSTATNLHQRSRADLLGAHVAAAHHERSIHLEVLRL